ncbi:11739_t:CDS:2, partial [Dentiscutata heterogama]
IQMSSQHKFERKKKPIWQWFKKGDKLNSSHYLAQCDFCKTNCPSKPLKMEKHLLKKCEDISQDEHDNTNNKQEIESISLSIGEKASINHQLLKALISANAPLSFVEDAEVIKLVHMLRPEYKLPSCKWISIDVLDNIHENIQCNIQHFISNSMFLTLSGNGWMNVSKNSMLNFIVTNEKHESQIFKIDNYSYLCHTGDNIFKIYKEIGMNLGLDK